MNASPVTAKAVRPTKPRRKKKIVELIEIGGKKVSKTSTGKRKFHNKSKNGCDNCKRRRVKCDENKPACLKCSNMKLDCKYSILSHPLPPPNTLTTTIIIDKTLENQVEDRSSQDLKEEEEEEENEQEEKEEEEKEDIVVKKKAKPRKNKKNKSNSKLEYNDLNNLSALKSSNLTDNASQSQQGNLLYNIKREENGKSIRDQRKSSIVIPLNSPEKHNSIASMDSLLLPSLSNSAESNAHFLQQQLYLLPQLMSLSNSEKFTNFDLTNIGGLNVSNMNTNPSVGNLKNPTTSNNKAAKTNSSFNSTLLSNPLGLDSPLQAVPLNQSNSISSLLSMNKFTNLPNLLNGNISNANTPNPNTPNPNPNTPNANLTQPLSLNGNFTNTGMNNHFQNNTNNNNTYNSKSNPLSIYSDSMALLKNAGINLKTLLGGSQIPGLSNLDLQDTASLLKTTQSMKINVAEEILANMQKQLAKSINTPSNNGDINGLNTSQSVGTPALLNNPTITPSAKILPSPKNNLENDPTTLQSLATTLQTISSMNSNANTNIPTSNRNSISIENNMTSRTNQRDSNNTLGLSDPLSNHNNPMSKDVESNDGNYSKHSSSLSRSNTASSTKLNYKNYHNSKSSIVNLVKMSQEISLNLVDLKLLYHYCTVVWRTIIDVGISGVELWSKEIPELAFEYPFLMHSLLAFSATHLSRQEYGLENFVSSHRIEALRLLREAVLQISPENTDALVASALILIMDSLANASGGVTNNPYRSNSNNINLDGTDTELESPTNTNDIGSSISNNSGSNNMMSGNAMTASAWIFHVKGASTILTAVWPLDENSKFHDLISIDLTDFSNLITQEINKDQKLNGDNLNSTPSSTGSSFITELVCFDESITDLYPVEIDSPYLLTLAILDKLNRERDEANFILKIFAFPALLDKTFLALLMTGDLGAMRIMRSYYKLLRGYTTQMMDKVWFLEGVSQVLPQDVDEYSGGGGMHMMLDFLGGGLPSMTTTNLSEFM